MLSLTSITLEQSVPARGQVWQDNYRYLGYVILAGGPSGRDRASHEHAHGSGGGWSTASLPARTALCVDGCPTSGPQVRQPRTITLGIGQIAADEQPTSETRSIRDCPLFTVANCTLIA